MRRNNGLDRYQTSRRSRALDRDEYTRGAVDDYDDYEYDDGETYDYEGYDDDYDYEDYEELGSNYDPENDPNYGYDNYDGYEEYEADTYAPDNLSPRSSGNGYIQDLARNTAKRLRSGIPAAEGRGNAAPRGRNIDTSRFGERAPDRLDFSSFNRKSRDAEDMSRYLDYIERYDNGDIDNYDMSRVQRKFANKAFWETFEPSEKMIREYGSGNESTKWPLFEWKRGRWSPIIWRED